jgi:hypothetical protein
MFDYFSYASIGWTINFDCASPANSPDFREAVLKESTRRREMTVLYPMMYTHTCSAIDSLKIELLQVRALRFLR